MRAEAICTECGADIWLSVKSIQTAPMSGICDLCQAAEDEAATEPIEQKEAV